MKKQPKLRFPGFTDDWEQHKLGELGTVQTCKRIFKEQTSEQGDIPFFKNGTIGLEPDSYISREVYEEFRRLYPYPEVGDTLISVVGSIGRTAEYTGKDEYFQDSNVVWLKTDGSINKKFLKISYQVIKWLIEGSTVKHLYNDNILRSELVMPVSQIEQAKIAEFFEALDNLITLHQRELDEWKNFKKGMLQKMFPKKGKSKPELRFPGFTDDWEQRKCGEVLIERNIQHPQNDEFPLVSFTVENGVTPKTDRYEREQLVRGDKGEKKYKETHLDDIVYNPANLKFGAISRNKYGNAVFSPIYVTYEVNKKLALPAFVEMCVTRDLFIQTALQYQQGTVYERMSVNTEDFATLDLVLPSKNEQEQIGEYFEQLDNLITLHQEQLENYRELKKALLQQMFI